MEPTVYQVKIRVYLNDLLTFYKDNPKYGTQANPYPADSFFEIICPQAKFWGPLKNVIILESNCTYQWSIVTKDNLPVIFSSINNSIMEFEMLSPDPSTPKWEKIFTNPEVDNNKVKVKPIKKDEDIFELNTVSNIEPTVRLKYSFLFEFTDTNGTVKYGSIDPNGVTSPPPE